MNRQGDTNVQPTRVVSFDYTNYRGEKSRRNVSPITLRFGVSDYHDEPQFLMIAYDRDKLEFREFTLRDMTNVLADEFLNELAPAQGNIPMLP
jgi:predicted DNA-binding transcriptional regulator YafY